MAKSRRVGRATLTETIEEQLRSDIISGVLHPGSRLSAADLTERYDVSPTPLREALQRLAGERLVDMDPRLGARVAAVSRAHLRDTYRARKLLESVAVRESILHGDAEWENELRRAFGQLEIALAESKPAEPSAVLTWARSHANFHEVLISACASPWILTLLSTVHSHTERYRVLAAVTGARDPHSEHIAIYTAALERDPDRAAAALELHLDRTVELIEQSVDELNDDEDDA